MSYQTFIGTLQALQQWVVPNRDFPIPQSLEDIAQQQKREVHVFFDILGWVHTGDLVVHWRTLDPVKNQYRLAFNQRVTFEKPPATRWDETAARTRLTHDMAPCVARLKQRLTVDPDGAAQCLEKAMSEWGVHHPRQLVVIYKPQEDKIALVVR